MKLIVGLGNPGEKYSTTRHNTGFMALDAVASNFSAKGGSAPGGQFSPPAGGFNFQAILNAQISTGMFKNEKIILAKPQTFMNESGKAVKALVDYYGALRTRIKNKSGSIGRAESAEAEKNIYSSAKLETRVSAEADKIHSSDIIVIHDDLDILLGEYKIMRNRGSAGHKGVQSIIDALGTKDFTRIRIGIGVEEIQRPGLSRETGSLKPASDFVLENFTKEERKVINGVIERVVEEIEKMF